MYDEKKLSGLGAVVALATAFALAGAAYAAPGEVKGKPDKGGGGHNTVVKTFVDGPLDPNTGDVIDLDPIFGLDNDAGANENDDAGAFQDSLDVGIIGIGLVESQGYIFKMNIVADDGAFVADTIPAEYDLSPRLQDVTDTFGYGNACENGISSGVFDADCTTSDDLCHDAGGLAFLCEGFVSDDAACWVETSRPPGATANGKDTNRHKQPEFVTVSVDTDSTDCDVFVFVETDGNPGHFVETDPPTTPLSPDDDFTLWSPTGCTAFEHDGILLEAGDGSAYVESILLNDDVSEYDPVDGDRVQGPDQHLLLTPIGCDSDGDLVIDELDSCPVEGPLTVDANGDGCED